MYGIWAYLSTFSRVWALIWKLGSGSGFGSASNKNQNPHPYTHQSDADPQQWFPDPLSMQKTLGTVVKQVLCCCLVTAGGGWRTTTHSSPVLWPCSSAMAPTWRQWKRSYSSVQRDPSVFFYVQIVQNLNFKVIYCKQRTKRYRVHFSPALSQVTFSYLVSSLKVGLWIRIWSNTVFSQAISGSLLFATGTSGIKFFTKPTTCASDFHQNVMKCENTKTGTVLLLNAFDFVMQKFDYSRKGSSFDTNGIHFFPKRLVQSYETFFYAVLGIVSKWSML